MRLILFIAFVFSYNSRTSLSFCCGNLKTSREGTVLNSKYEEGRRAFMSSTYASIALTFAPTLANAIGEESEGDSGTFSNETTKLTFSKRTIEGCPKVVSGKSPNCVATSNIRQLDTYSPPWTFEASPGEAWARVKGLASSDPSFTIQELNEDEKYVRFDVQRPGLGKIKDTVELLVKDDDKVVVFKSAEKEPTSVPDFGLNRNRLDELRKSGGIFNVMGNGIGSADSYNGGSAKQNGVLGQLKAFYGLQSGEGYEDVFAED